MNALHVALLGLITASLVFVALGKIRLDAAALFLAIALGSLQAFGLGVLGPANTPGDAVNALLGFGQPAVMTLISLFVLTSALERAGATRWLATHLLRLGGNSERRLVVVFASATAILSLVMNNVAAGALVLPSAMDVCRRTKISPGKLLLPVAYGSLLGGAATYFTTANIIISNLLLAAHPPQRPLHILDFTPTGGLIAVAGIAYLGLWGYRLLPAKGPESGERLARPSGSELEAIYELGSRLWEARVLAGSRVLGKKITELDFGSRLGIAVVAVVRRQQIILGLSSNAKIVEGDLLLLVGREERIGGLATEGLSIEPRPEGAPLSLQGVTLLELVLAPRSKAADKSLRELGFRQLHAVTPIALLRKGRSYRTDVADIPLELGDTILVVGDDNAIRKLQHSPDFIAFEAANDQRPINVRGALSAVGALLAAVIVSILGFPDYLAMTAGALAIIMSGQISMEEAYDAVDWRTIFLVAGMYAVSHAIVATGLAALAGEKFVGVIAPFGPLGLAAGAYVVSALLSQVIGGQVVTLVTGPVLISAAITLHTNPQAVAVAAAIGCSASFLSPVAHPVSILVMGPGGYSFRDFLRVGLPLTIISFFVLLIGLRMFWNL